MKNHFILFVLFFNAFGVLAQTHHAVYWTFMIKGNNLLDNGIKNKISFSDFMIHNTTTYILPRAILFSVQYKL